MFSLWKLLEVSRLLNQTRAQLVIEAACTFQKPGYANNINNNINVDYLLYTYKLMQKGLGYTMELYEGKHACRQKKLRYHSN